MKHLKNISTRVVLSFIILAFSLVAVPAHNSYAGTDLFNEACSEAGSGGSAACADRTSKDPLVGPNGIIIDVTRIIALIAGVTAVIIMMVAGLMYVLSGGDSNKIATAKNTIIYAAVGLVVIGVGQQIIAFVVAKL